MYESYNQQQNYLKEKEELEKCPFHPNVKITKELSYQKLEETLDKLYQDSKNRDQIRKQNLELKQKQEKSNLSAINFKPEINDPLDNKIFTDNTLIQEDKHILNEKRRFETARSQKQFSNLYQIRSSSEDAFYDSEDKKRPFNFSIEKKTFKDGFHNLFTPKASSGNVEFKKGKRYAFLL